MKRNTTVKTPYGIYLPRDSRAKILSYLGIPYAKPPIDELRWLPPQTLDHSDAVMKCNKFGPAPLQPRKEIEGKNYIKWHEVVESSEDCLYLNIWTADIDTPNKPVLFWLFGGSNHTGTTDRSLFNGQNFVERHPDCIVVTVAYRLGALGTLNLTPFDPEGKYKESNNLLLLDQRKALEWVYENISAFGGDPNRITMYGHSAGSFDICLHLCLEESTKYMYGAICQSSFANAVILPDIGVENSYEESLWFGEQFKVITGCNTMEELLELSEEEILEAQEKLWKLKHPVSKAMKATAVADNITVPENCFEKMCKGSAAHVHVMTGVVNGEVDQQFAGEEAGAELIRKATGRRPVKDAPDGFVEEYIRTAMGYGVPEREATIDLRTEQAFGGPAMMYAEACSHFTDAYNFRFMWNDPEVFNRTPHGMPQPFAFLNCIPKKAPEHLAEQVNDAWAAFMKTGNPNHPGIPYWPPYKKEDRETMLIDAEWSAVEDFQGECRDLIRSLYPKAKKLLDN